MFKVTSSQLRLSVLYVKVTLLHHILSLFSVHIPSPSHICERQNLKTKSEKNERRSKGANKYKKEEINGLRKCVYNFFKCLDII